MALTVGELVGYLTLDDSMFERTLTKGKESFAKVGTFFRDHGKAMGMTAGAATGTALAVGISTNLDLGAGRALLDAQLDLTAEDAKLAGKAAGQLYAGDFAGSLDEANAAIKAVVQNMNVSAKDVNLEPIAAQALTVSKILDEDVGRTTAAVSTLMKTGLAKSSKEAFDILAKGASLGVNKAEDMLDTFTEYPTTFKMLGISGKDALGLMNQGLQAGARNSDIVADAIKEFSIRAIDGSKSTASGFKALGMNADDMRKRIAKGGPSARQAFGEVLDALRKIEDPAKRQAAAVELFGTKAEDMGKSLQAMDLDTSAKGLENIKGAADRASDALGSSAQSKVDAFRKKVQLWTASLIEVDGPVGTVTAGVAAFGGSVLSTLGPIATLILAHRAARAAQVAETVATNAGIMARARSTAGMIVNTATGIATSAATKAWTAAQWLLNAALTANPIGLVIVALVALGAGLVLAYKKSETFRNIVNGALHAVASAVGWVVEFVKAHWPLILAILTGPVGLAVLFIVKNMDKIRGFMSATWSAIRNGAKAAWNGVTSIVSNGASSVVNSVKAIPGKLRGLAGSWASAGRSLINAFVGGLKNAGGIISGISGNVWKAVKDLLNGAIDRINSALEFKIALPAMKDIHVNPKNIPHLANGAHADGATLAVIGEGAEPESVLPDSVLRGLLERAHDAGASGGGDGPSGPDGSRVQIDVHPREGQSEESIADGVAARLEFAMSE